MGNRHSPRTAKRRCQQRGLVKPPLRKAGARQWHGHEHRTIGRAIENLIHQHNDGCHQTPPTRVLKRRHQPGDRGVVFQRLTRPGHGGRALRTRCHLLRPRVATALTPCPRESRQRTEAWCAGHGSGYAAHGARTGRNDLDHGGEMAQNRHARSMAVVPRMPPASFAPPHAHTRDNSPQVPISLRRATVGVKAGLAVPDVDPQEHHRFNREGTGD